MKYPREKEGGESQGHLQGRRRKEKGGRADPLLGVDIYEITFYKVFGKR